MQPKSEPIPNQEGQEDILENILNHRKGERGYLFLTSIKFEPSQDARWQSTSDVWDKDGGYNIIWLKCIKKVHSS